MPFNGSGSFSPPGADFPAVPSTLIESTKFNNVVNDIATGLSTAITKDGQTTVTANIPLSGYKLTGVGAATARTDAATLASIQDGTGVYVSTTGGTADVFTLTPSPAITAYATGQEFMFLAVGTNTTAVTVAVNGLAAKAVQSSGSALTGGELVSGKLYKIVYDGTQFQISLVSVSPFIATLLNDAAASNARTTLGAVGLTGNETIAGDKTFSGNTINSGTVTMSGKSMYWAKGADIVSAATLVLGTDGNMFDVTGSTGPITAITVPAVMLFMLQFDSTPTLTHHATNLNLPGGANRTAKAGDRLIGFATAANQVHVIDYIDVDGLPVVASISQTPTATTSGTSKDYTGIPSWVNKIVVMLNEVSGNGTSDLIVQLGDSGGMENTGYTCVATRFNAGTSEANFTTGFAFCPALAATNTVSGTMVLTKESAATNTWTMVSSSRRESSIPSMSAGIKSLSDVLTQLRLTYVNGTDAFDAGEFNVRYYP